MTARFGRFLGLVFSVCLLTTYGTTVANAQDSADAGATSETCDPAIQQRAEEHAAENLEHAQRVTTGIFQPIEPSAELVCLDDQIASASNTIGSIFSDNPDFFNSIKNSITLPGNIQDTVLSTLASVLSGNPFSSGGIGDLLGGILGFTMPSQCDGMQGLFERVAGQNIVGLVGPAGSFDPLEMLGFSFAMPGMSAIGNVGQGSLSTPIPDNRVPDGECRKYVTMTLANGKELGGCHAGKGATCRVTPEGYETTFECSTN